MVAFCWSLTLRVASQHPVLPESAAAICEEDEDVAELAIQKGIFSFLSKSIVQSESFTQRVSQ